MTWIFLCEILQYVVYWTRNSNIIFFILKLALATRKAHVVLKHAEKLNDIARLNECF